MSRDWRPIEQVMADEQIYRLQGTRLSEAKLVLKGENGNPDEQLWNDEARAEYPVLCFLLPGFETKEYEKTCSDEMVRRVYKKIEEDLNTLSDSVRKQLSAGKKNFVMTRLKEIRNSFPSTCFSL